MLIKSKQDIAQIKKGGVLIGEILGRLAKLVKPGASTWEIDQAAEKMVLAVGGKPAFKNYKNHPHDIPFPTTICASINEELVHGVARKNAILKNGDIFSIDIGMEWPAFAEATAGKPANVPSGLWRGKPVNKGLFTDTAITAAVGEIPEKTKKLLAVTKQALEIGIKAVKPGASVAAIGRAIENFVKSQPGEYAIVRDLVGHGVGHEVHEEPHVPNYYDSQLESMILKPGMVIALEPMISLGKDCRIKTNADGWTIEMASGSLCAHSEHTVIVTKKGNIVATRRPGEKEEKFW